MFHKTVHNWISISSSIDYRSSEVTLDTYFVAISFVNIRSGRSKGQLLMLRLWSRRNGFSRQPFPTAAVRSTPRRDSIDPAGRRAETDAEQSRKVVVVVVVCLFVHLFVSFSAFMFVHSLMKNWPSTRTLKRVRRQFIADGISVSTPSSVPRLCQTMCVGWIIRVHMVQLFPRPSVYSFFITHESDMQEVLHSALCPFFVAADIVAVTIVLDSANSVTASCLKQK